MNQLTRATTAFPLILLGGGGGSMGIVKDLKGIKFGRWTVLSFDKIKNNRAYWFCECDCGNKKSVDGVELRRGNSISCGCFRDEGILKRATKHNQRYSSTYKSYQGIVARTENINSREYKNYGGRGIKRCEKWKTFEGFYEDMGDRPKGKTIDRIDVNGDYCKENCRWSTPKEQANNRRNNILITYNNKTQTLMQWSNELGFNFCVLSARLGKLHWTIRKAFTTPVQFQKKHKRTS